MNSLWWNGENCIQFIINNLIVRSVFYRRILYIYYVINISNVTNAAYVKPSNFSNAILRVDESTTQSSYLVKRSEDLATSAIDLQVQAALFSRAS